MTKVSILLAFVARGYAENLAAHDTSKVQDGMDKIANEVADNLINKLVDKLVSLAMSQRSSLLSAPSSRLPSLRPRAPSSAHVVHAVQVPLGGDDSKTHDPWNPFVMKTGSKKKDSYADWNQQYRVLVDNLKPLSPFDAEEMIQNEGAVLVDVRPEAKFNEFSIEDAINVPLFREAKGTSLRDVAKRSVTGVMAVKAMERNPDFVALANQKLPRDKPIIIACDRGGLLDVTYEDAAKVEVPPMVKLINSMTTPFMPKTGTKDFNRYPNRYTVSLKAAYELHQAGFTNLYFIEGGMRKWDEDGLPLVAGDDWKGDLPEAP